MYAYDGSNNFNTTIENQSVLSLAASGLGGYLVVGTNKGIAVINDQWNPEKIVINN